MPDKTLRLILGDQLNASHSWYREQDDNVLYVIAELKQETSYVTHHLQKICAFFAAMAALADELTKAGHKVLHLSLDDTGDHADLPSLIESLCREHQIKRFEYQRPDEYRLARQLQEISLNGVTEKCVESEHFLVDFDEIAELFEKGKSTRMESFYRKMRRRFEVLMDGGEPLGGQWNFDEQNRAKLKRSDLSHIPKPLLFDNDVSAILRRLEEHEIDHFGDIGESLLWPVNQQQARDLLDYFCVECLPKFGQFQDAMTADSNFAWSLFHSRLSFALNSKILNPMQVIERAIDEHESRPDEINLAQIEGFVRQILGWREFMRGIYWANMPDYQQQNTLQAKRNLPGFFWTAETNMRCMQQSLGQSLEFAYAHHIQRLMVIGNFCLLAGIDPEQVDAWYLGVYIDAIEWVEMPNTRGMSQFADGGIVASKPYSGSGAYINRMSDYCSDCSYAVKEKVGENACPFNSLYWHFMHRHRERFGNNARIGMIYRNLDRMDSELRDDTLGRAEQLLESLEDL
ncbi:MAG: cryptochrome/photolyase family protein [Gammaproteobacteria bacterium]|nr:cryptochrome/photolyase family protein [Gammaproteobacteria bacterium]